MDIKITITVDREDIETYRKEFIECNHYDLTDEEILTDYEEWFYADCSEYVKDVADIEIKIKED